MKASDMLMPQLLVVPTLVLGQVDLNPGGCCSWVFASLVAGWLAGSLARGRGFGCFGDILLGLVGAAVGVFILNAIGANFSSQLGFFGTMAVAFLGAFALALIGRLIGNSQRTTNNTFRDWPTNKSGN